MKKPPLSPQATLWAGLSTSSYYEVSQSLSKGADLSLELSSECIQELSDHYAPLTFDRMRVTLIQGALPLHTLLRLASSHKSPLQIQDVLKGVLIAPNTSVFSKVDHKGHTVLLLASALSSDALPLPLFKKIIKRTPSHLLDARTHHTFSVGTGATALHLAAHWRALQRCRFLIEAGVDVNSVDAAGRTVLEYAAEPHSAVVAHHGRAKQQAARFEHIMRVFTKEYGLNWRQKDTSGKTVFDKALEECDMDLLLFLRKAGAVWTENARGLSLDDILPYLKEKALSSHYFPALQADVEAELLKRTLCKDMPVLSPQCPARMRM